MSAHSRQAPCCNRSSATCIEPRTPVQCSAVWAVTSAAFTFAPCCTIYIYTHIYSHPQYHHHEHQPVKAAEFHASGVWTLHPKTEKTYENVESMKPHSIWSAYRRTPNVHRQQPTQSKQQSLMPVVSEPKTLKHKNPRKGRQHEASLHLIGIHKNSSCAQNNNPTPNQCKLEHPSLFQPSRRSSREIATASCSIACSS